MVLVLDLVMVMVAIRVGESPSKLDPNRGGESGFFQSVVIQSEVATPNPLRGVKRLL